MGKPFFILLCLLAGIYTVRAQNINDSVRVLFIGNSYTHFNKLPDDIQKIAATQKIILLYQACVRGGYSFKKHLQKQEEIEIIKEGKWDFVILQEHSEAPAKPTEVVAQETYPYARALDSLVHVYNPKAHVIFYMTWAHKDGCLSPIADYPLIDTYTGMQERLKTSYLEMAYQNNAWCAPVGMVWQQVRRERPDYV